MSTNLACCSSHSAVNRLMSQALIPQFGVPDDLSQLWLPERAVRGAVRYADLLVLGSIATGIPGQSTAEAMAVADGRVTAIGSASDLEGLKGPNTEILRAGDGVIVPGLIEPHMHLWSSLIVDSYADCSQLENPTLDDVVARLKAEAAKAGPGEWITGKLFDPSLYPGEPDLTIEILDQVSDTNPVAVLNASMHYLYVNSKAFELAGITAETPDPPSGRFYRNDGKLTGVVGESSAILRFVGVMPQMTPEQAAAGMRSILNRAAATGVTSVREALTGAIMGTSEIGALHQLNGAARLPVRISTAQFSALGNDKWAEAGITPGAGDDMVRADAWKIVSDGSNQGRSGYMREDYLGTDERGEANWTEEQLTGFIREGHDAGWQIMCHANGDAAIDEVLAAFQDVLGDAGDTKGLRHRVEHCSIGHERQFEHMAKLGLSPSFLMNHVYYWGAAFRDNLLGKERAEHLDMAATAGRHGLRYSLHSDFSVSPINPLVAARTAVLREVRDGGEVLNASERVSAHDALKAVTVDAAWQIRSDDAGKLEAGSKADFAILTANPWETDPAGWGDIKTLETRIAGTTAWSS